MIKKKIPSAHPPLGVMPSLISDVGLSVHSINEQDNVVMISDGIVEARSPEDQMFGTKRFEKSIRQGARAGKIAETLITEVNLFCQSMPQEDDLSIIEIIVLVTYNMRSIKFHIKFTATYVYSDC